MLLPIIMILFCLVSGSVAYFLIKLNEKNKYKTKNIPEITANEFINVKDINGNFLYTVDGNVLCYMKLNPISIDLYSKTEKKNIIKSLTAELSAQGMPFKLIAVSRPVDISPLLSELASLLTTTNKEQKDLLVSEISEMTDFAMNGEVVERQFFIIIWDKQLEGVERELLSRARVLAERFGNNKIFCEILKQQDIVRLCNLVNNPSYTHLEKDNNLDNTIPLIDGGIKL